MGEHDAPASWLERWQEQEPLRLWLWSIACATIVLAGVAGWLTAELAVAITGVVAALLMVGGTAAARKLAYAPATVDLLLDRQHADSYGRGYRAALEQAVLEPATQQLRAQRPAPPSRQQATGRCRYVESGRRCVANVHPENVLHRLEDPRPRE